MDFSSPAFKLNVLFGLTVLFAILQTFTSQYCEHADKTACFNSPLSSYKTADTSHLSGDMKSAVNTVSTGQTMCVLGFVLSLGLVGVLAFKGYNQYIAKKANPPLVVKGTLAVAVAALLFYIIGVAMVDSGLSTIGDLLEKAGDKTGLSGGPGAALFFAIFTCIGLATDFYLTSATGGVGYTEV
mmetsp:Transcript_14736/g.46260  ORF Transcript_14736/g.46260 Transcript_14736/m.46260 type:complete len:184 (-) Transcript_14736:27-578(-)